MSGIGVGLASSFLWASEGDVRHFFGGWFLDRLGLNPAGVELFRLRAGRRPELPPKLPLQLHPQLHPLHGFCMVFSCFRSCLSGDVRHWRWPFFIFLVGVRRRREALFRGLVFGQVGLESCWGWAVSAPCRTEAGAATEAAISSSIHYMVFAWFFHAFEAACLAMSGIGVGLASSFLRASEGDVRHFFGGWFLDRLGLNPAGAWLFRLRAERRPATEAAIAAPSTAPSTTWFLHGFFMLSKLPVW